MAFREQDGDQVSAEAIAARAGMSTPSLYNLIGTREALLGALLDDMFLSLEERVSALGAADPIARGQAVVIEGARLFAADPQVFRYVVRRSGALQRISDVGVEHPPLPLQIEAMTAAQRSGLITEQLPGRQIARQILVCFIGAMREWGGELYGSDAFEAQTAHGFWTVIAATAVRAELRERALSEMAALAPRLPC